ncbi:hypothetical protein JTB14_006993 [Gonioctena quinquepunctata]|nr:hypothetical protein JTB14_006993 [Gonioctena quinquepunctata]
MKIRLESFVDWPRGLSQKPKELAEARFFYTGRSDRVKCFHCGLGVKNWMPGDGAMTLHELINDECEFWKLKNLEKNSTVITAETLSCKICLENGISVVFMP